ncbi:MAG: flavin reductase (DIM6/NTAB) family NADH-FMN oxidoreductase RutF [Paracoccaceae bacterium]|jgi:flavin reductase (DIM6/NTAB) family NADH-FMN oxidoreductase RutF
MLLPESDPSMPHTSSHRFDPADLDSLRGALGRFATGVTVITARNFDGTPVGFTANSFNSVSLDPPLILWSLARSSPRLGAYRAAEHYAVNILSADQSALARRFAGKTEDRFEGIAWSEGLGGAPVLDGALAVFECAHEAVYPAGDHELFIGRVSRCAIAEGAPLTFFAGRFGSVMGPAAAPDRALEQTLRAAADHVAAGGEAALSTLSGPEATELRRLLGRIAPG